MPGVPPIVTDALVREAGRISTDMGTRQSVHSPITALMAKGVFEPGMGVSRSSLLFERSAITNTYDWTAVGLNSNDTLNSCNPYPDVVSSATTLFPYQLYQRAVTSTYLCWNDLYSALEAQKQVANLGKQLRDKVLDLWEEQDRTNYITAARHKMVYQGNYLIDQPDSFASVAADSTATPEMMANIYQRIVQDGGAGSFDSALGMADGQYIFPALMSMEQAQFLEHNSGQRDDIRWNSGKVGELLQPYSINRVRNGFAYMIDPKTPRYTFSGGVYTRVPFYVNSAATNGTKQEVNPAYLTAPYEDMIFFMKDVVTREMPRPSIPTAEASFDPQRSAGEVFWSNIQNDTTNILGNTGRFYAQLQAAYRQENPYLGYTVRLLRCPYNIRKNTCTGS